MYIKLFLHRASIYQVGSIKLLPGENLIERREFEKLQKNPFFKADVNEGKISLIFENENLENLKNLDDIPVEYGIAKPEKKEKKRGRPKKKES